MNDAIEDTYSLDWLVIFFVHEIAATEAVYKAAYDAIKIEIRKFKKEESIRVFMIEQRLDKEAGDYLYYSYHFLELKNNALINFDFKGEKIESWETALKYFLLKINAKNRLLLTWSHGTAFGINTEKYPIIIKQNSSDIRYIKSGGDEINSRSGGDAEEFFLKGNFEIIENNVYKLFVSPQQGKANIPMRLFNKSINPTDHFKQININISNDKNFKSKSNVQYFEKFALGKGCKDLNILWIWEIAKVLEDCSEVINPDKPLIDIMIMTNCYMNLSDNWYLLKDVVKYYIAPETSMDVNGYNYLKLLKSLTEKSKTIEKIAYGIITDFVIKNQTDDDPVTIETLQNTAIFCSDLSASTEAIIIFSKICETILQEEDDDNKTFEIILEDLRYLRKFDLQSVSETVRAGRIEVVDLSSLITNMPERLKLTISKPKFILTLQDLSSKYEILGKSMIVNSFIGADIIEKDAVQLKKFSPTGGSVFFPETSLVFVPFDNKFGICSYSNESTKSPYVNHTFWDDLLKKIYPDLFI